MTDFEDVYDRYFKDVFLFIKGMSGDDVLSEEIAEVCVSCSVGRFCFPSTSRTFVFYNIGVLFFAVNMGSCFWIKSNIKKNSHWFMKK